MWGDVGRCGEMWDLWEIWEMWGGRDVGNMGLRDVRNIGSEYRIGEMGKCAIRPSPLHEFAASASAITAAHSSRVKRGVSETQARSSILNGTGGYASITPLVVMACSASLGAPPRATLRELHTSAAGAGRAKAKRCQVVS